MKIFLFATIILLSQKLSAQENDILDWVDTAKEYIIYVNTYQNYTDERYNNSGQIVGKIKWRGIMPMLNGTVTYYTPDQRFELVSKHIISFYLDSHIVIVESGSFNCFQGTENIYGYLNNIYLKPNHQSKNKTSYFGHLVSNGCDYLSDKKVLCGLNRVSMVEVPTRSPIPVSDKKHSTENNLAVSIYPNPTKDFISIEYNEELRKNLTSFEIVNIQGKSKLTLSQNTECPISKINVSNLEKGIYILVGKNQNEQTIFSSKVEKQ